MRLAGCLRNRDTKVCTVRDIRETIVARLEYSSFRYVTPHADKLASLVRRQSALITWYGVERDDFSLNDFVGQCKFSLSRLATPFSGLLIV